MNTATLIQIEEAKNEDRSWVTALMCSVLDDFYSGDHAAHANRIFNAHISGGRDDIGFFSYEQKMFIARQDGCAVGMLHLVGKKQSTYKISPLIVDSSFRKTQGIGIQLLQYAINYAKQMGARQIYCTVAEKNINAYRFFIKHGFIVAGYSNSHYKEGVVEHMLFLPVNNENELLRLDRDHITVRPLSEINADLRNNIRSLLLDRLPKSFSGVDDKWIDSLFGGYDRRKYKDVNSKYKLLFVATNSKTELLGVVGATPKKGNPIKLMPFIALDDHAFEALLSDIPFLLKEYGHKLYIHIEPNSNHVMILQKLGWKINALLPSAYMLGVTTQQWSFDVGVETIRIIRIKNQLLNEIIGKRKTIEVRVGYESIKKIMINEVIKFQANQLSVHVKVTSICVYSSFNELLSNENWKNIIPYASNELEVKAKLEEFYDSSKVALGIYAIKFDLF